MIRPARPIAALLSAPSFSPISRALAVPTAWEDVPIPTPTAIGLTPRSSFITHGAINAPPIPVRITMMTVSEPVPPSISLSDNAIGVVMDLGNNEIRNSSGNSRSLLSNNILKNDTTTPEVMPIIRLKK